MKVYAIRKRRGQWAVCCEENVLLQFETYAEAVEIARAASVVLASRRSTSVIAPSPLAGEGYSAGTRTMNR
jgi:hypothetical protein